MTPDGAWQLIEQDLIPSARESAREDFYALLARIWDEGFTRGVDAGSIDSDLHETREIDLNPYRASEGK